MSEPEITEESVEKRLGRKPSQLDMQIARMNAGEIDPEEAGREIMRGFDLANQMTTTPPDLTNETLDEIFAQIERMRSAPGYVEPNTIIVDTMGTPVTRVLGKEGMVQALIVNPPQQP